LFSATASGHGFPAGCGWSLVRLAGLVFVRLPLGPLSGPFIGPALPAAGCKPWRLSAACRMRPAVLHAPAAVSRTEPAQSRLDGSVY
jgi:hypothetical protein